MKKLILLAIAISMIAGCTKEQFDSTEYSTQPVSKQEQENAIKDFSAILSQAVAENKDLRTFIKETALQQFDMDYDVFYPYVKNQVVPGDDRTFRDILLQYSEDPAHFEEIETSLPLLTILVPDWSYLGCFSILDWNPESSEIAVGFETSSGNKPIYADGELVGSLQDGAIPDFPTLIVKKSDRMRQANPLTKSNGEEFEFIDDSFNAALHPKTKVSHEHSDVTIDGIPDVSNFIPEENVPNILKETYKKLKDEPYAVQRDYIYFGISPDQPVGRENYHYKEYIHKFKFHNTDALKNGALDDGDDFIAQDPKWEYKQNYAAKSAEQLRNHFYSDGAIELKFTIIIPMKDGSVFQTSKVVGANFGDVFAIDKANLDYRHRTWFCKDWYVYTIDDSYIHPKWYTVDIDLPRWNLGSDSDIMSIYIEEIDPSETIKKEITVRYNESETTEIGGGADVGVDVGVEISGNISVNHSQTSENERMEKTTIETTAGSDELGIISIYFVEPVVLGEKTENAQEGYLINTLSCGSIDMMVMPKQI